MAGVSLAHCGKIRSFTRLLCQHNPHFSKYLNNQVENKYRRLAVISIRSLCSSTSSESQSKSDPVVETSKRPFDLTFEEFQKLKRKIRSRQRIAGLPIAAVALMTSSAVSAYLNPNMFDAPPDQIQPIM